MEVATKEKNSKRKPSPNTGKVAALADERASVSRYVIQGQNGGGKRSLVLFGQNQMDYISLKVIEICKICIARG